MKKLAVLGMLVMFALALTACGGVNLSAFAEENAPEAVSRVAENHDEFIIHEMHWFAIHVEGEMDGEEGETTMVVYYFKLEVDGDEVIEIHEYYVGSDEEEDFDEWNQPWYFGDDEFEDIREEFVGIMYDMIEEEEDADMSDDYGTFTEDQINAWLNE